MSYTIMQGGREYGVPREVEAEGGAAVEGWLASQLLAEQPREALSRMTRAELEAEAARLAVDVQPASEDAELVNADYVRAIEARRGELAALAPPSDAGEEPAADPDPDQE